MTPGGLAGDGQHLEEALCLHPVHASKSYVEE